MPLATEALGQTRARGVGFLAEKQIDAEGRARLAGLVQQAVDQHAAMALAFDKSFAFNPALKQKLGANVTALASQVQASLKLANDELVVRESLDYAAPDYIKQLTGTIDALFTSGYTAMDELEGLLKTRVSSQRMSMIWLSLALVALTVVFLLILRAIMRSITGPLRQAAELAQSIAERDLSTEFKQDRQDEVGVLNQALLAMRDSLRGVIHELRGNAGEVASAAQEVAVGNQDLSKRTEQAASALEQTSSSMQEMTGTVSGNAELAKQASRMAQQACQTTERGGEVVQQVVHTMGGIEASSRKIEEIIAVIDSIAFQTNILALNAAVEAARAGEQGRGFAVVASEVRALAGRSAEAARQIKQLISTSVEQVSSGVVMVRDAGSTMQEAVATMGQLAEMVDRISRASIEQSSGLQQINQAVSHMDELTQQNAALVEETAAAGMSLQEQAQRLSGLVQTFRVPGG